MQKSTPGAALLLPCHAKGKMEVDAARTQRPVLKKESSSKFPKKKTLKHLRRAENWDGGSEDESCHLTTFDQGDRSSAHLQSGKMWIALNPLRPRPHNRVLGLHGVCHYEEDGDDDGKYYLGGAVDGLTKMPEVLW